MSSSRILPKSNISRQKAMNTAKTKKDSLPSAKNAMTPTTSTRLDTDNASYNALMDAVTAAEQVQREAGEAADPWRLLLHDNIGSYFKGLNIGIVIKEIPNSARSFYKLPIGNKKLPVTNTDAQLLDWGQKIITGDAKRVLDGGYVITLPTIASFTAVFNSTKTAITAFSNAKTALTDAQTAVNAKEAEMNSLILRMWNEIETTYSELDPPAKRSAARQWGVKYLFIGNPAIVSGIITNSITGLPMARVTVKLMGSNNKVLTDDNGYFELNTSLYGDLELLAKITGYTDNITDILMENGGTMVVDVMMVHK